MTVIALAAIIAVSAFTQSISGFGFAMVGVPLIALLTDPLTAVVCVTVLSAIYSTGAATHERALVDWGALRVVSLAALFGMPIGLLLAHEVPSPVLSVGIGGVVIICALTVGRSTRQVGRPGSVAAGVASGALLTSTGMNGPPLVLAMKGMDPDPNRFRATLQAVFVVQDLCAIVGFAVVGSVTAQRLFMVAWTAPALLIGWWVGRRLLPLIDEHRFDRIVVRLLILTGLVAIASALR